VPINTGLSNSKEKKKKSNEKGTSLNEEGINPD
jgi:hypothetical protein